MSEVTFFLNYWLDYSYPYISHRFYISTERYARKFLGWSLHQKHDEMNFEKLQLVMIYS